MNMKKIINAILYGDRKTREYILSVGILALLCIVFCVIGILIRNSILVLLALLSGIISFLISRSFTLVDVNYVAAKGSAGKKETVSASTVQTKKESKKENEKDVEVKEDEIVKPPTEYNQYHQKKIKRIFHKYHIKKDHRQIIIDESKEFRIRQCPAYIWRKNRSIHILLLEREPRQIVLPRSSVPYLEYARKVKADKEKEYIAFQKQSLIAMAFKEYLPDYYDSKSKDIKYKNLYMMQPDIRVTNHSAKQLMDLLYLELHINDEITNKKQVSRYFKEIYQYHILLKDKVISITEYKDKVMEQLEQMSMREMSKEKFDTTIENLVSSHFISEEYAKYYKERRLKNKQEQTAEKSQTS